MLIQPTYHSYRWTSPGTVNCTSYSLSLPSLLSQSKKLIHLLILPLSSLLSFFFFPSSTLEPLVSSDNTARIFTRRSGFRQQEQSIFYLPILVADSGQPVQSSTGTLTIQVCSCDDEGHIMSCSPKAYMLPVSLSRGALIAILACIFVLLGEYVCGETCGETSVLFPLCGDLLTRITVIPLTQLFRTSLSIPYLLKR